DVANPLYGVLGLVDLLLEDAAAGSNDEARLRLVQQAALEMKSTLRVLLDFARPADDGQARASLDDAVREAVVLLRHGAGRPLEVDERYPASPPSCRVHRAHSYRPCCTCCSPATRRNGSRSRSARSRCGSPPRRPS